MTTIQSHGMPAMKNMHAPGAENEDGLAEVGLRDEQREHDAEQDHGEEVAGDVGLALVLGEEPGADDDEGRLQEFRRLDGDAERATASDARP